MPVRIELFAKNVAIGSSVVEFALSHGCALVTYAEVSAPLAGTQKSAPPSRKRNRTGAYNFDNVRALRAGSMRLKAAEILRKMDPRPKTRPEVTARLNKTFEPSSVPALMAGLERAGIIVPNGA